MTIATFSKAERRALTIIAVAIFLSRIALALRPEWQVYTKPYIDDTFYVFSVCANIASGQGVTIDGSHLTNGFQPLIAFIDVPCFYLAGGDSLLALRFCFIITALVDSITAILLAILIRNLSHNRITDYKNIWGSPPILAAMAWASLITVSLHTLNGLETGLYSGFLIFSMLQYLKLQQQNSFRVKPWLGFGCLLGLTVLARVDAVFLVIAFAGIELFRNGKRGIKRASVLSLGAFIISLPWWLYNYFIFGSLMPQSGQSEAWGGSVLNNISIASGTLANIISLFFFLPEYSIPSWALFIWLAVMVSIIVLISKRTKMFEYFKTNHFFSPLAPLIFFAGFLWAYYVFFFNAPYYLPRYFQPIRILWIIFIACALPGLQSFLHKLSMPAKKFYHITIAVFIASVIAFNLYGYVRNFSIQTPSDMYLAAVWAKNHPELRIGMGQSGIAHFYSPNVTNLDGKVNYDALKAIKTEGIGKYISEMKFDYINDMPHVALPILKSAEKFGQYYDSVGLLARVVLYKHR